MSRIVYILCAIVVLGVIVMVHELGHFLMGRLCGIGVQEFSIGFGPKLLGWKRKDTQYSVRLIPLGGYCAFVGEDSTAADPRAFNNHPAWKRFLTVLSGPLMNFVLALACAFLFIVIFGVTTGTVMPTVGALSDGMPAVEAGLQVGDRIVSVNGEAITNDEAGVEKMQQVIQQAATDNPEQPVALVVDRDGEDIDISCMLKQGENGRYLIGITMGYVETNERLGLIDSAKQAGIYVKNVTVTMVDFLKKLFTTGQGIEDTAGPVYIIDTVATGVQEGFDAVLYLIVIISLNLGIMNLLPLPALDGGRLVFLVVEMIRRKPVKPEYEGWVHAAGLVLLMALILVITGRDIMRLFMG